METLFSKPVLTVRGRHVWTKKYILDSRRDRKVPGEDVLLKLILSSTIQDKCNRGGRLTSVIVTDEQSICKSSFKKSKG